MSQKLCEKCGETVEEAKAFCPGCGHAFVDEEKRENASEFDRLDSTVQLGQTMYNQMLSDMGLNISKAPDKPEKRIEIIQPAATANPAPTSVEKPKPPPAVSGSNTKWLIIGIVATVLLLALAVVVVAAAVLLYYYRLPVS